MLTQYRFFLVSMRWGKFESDTIFPNHMRFPCQHMQAFVGRKKKIITYRQVRAIILSKKLSNGTQKQGKPV